MTEIRVGTTIERDGELNLRIPCRKGDRVFAVVTIPPHSNQERAEARTLFLSLAKSSLLSTQSSYPTRDEFHVRD